MSEDKKWMKGALALARRGLGNVAPNPAVGCLIVKEGLVLGRGWTQPGGRPHAETEALAQAGDLARGATVYVTLEPCAHHGVTPPCAEALLKAGVMRVVIAAGDKDQRVSGRGVKMLQGAGVEVVEYLLVEEAEYLNKGFFLAITGERPLFSLKMASTLDGKIATKNGESKWITGPEARRYGHMLRAQHDAILVGVNTVLADNPDLTCRIEGLEQHSPIRIVLDSDLHMQPEALMFKSVDQAPIWIITNEKMRNSEKSVALSAAGAELVFVDDTRNLKCIAKRLAVKGLTRVLVEGGAAIHASFLHAGMCDTLYHFTAPKLIGNDGLGAVGSLGLAQLCHSPHLKLVSHKKIGEDLLATYRKAG